jgi:hypothetical protein
VLHLRCVRAGEQNSFDQRGNGRDIYHAVMLSCFPEI